MQLNIRKGKVFLFTMAQWLCSRGPIIFYVKIQIEGYDDIPKLRIMALSLRISIYFRDLHMIFYYPTLLNGKKNSNNYIATIFNKIFTIVPINGCVPVHYATVCVGVKLNVDNPNIFAIDTFFISCLRKAEFQLNYSSSSCCMLCFNSES